MTSGAVLERCAIALDLGESKNYAASGVDRAELCAPGVAEGVRDFGIAVEIDHSDEIRCTATARIGFAESCEAVGEGLGDGYAEAIRVCLGVGARAIDHQCDLAAAADTEGGVQGGAGLREHSVRRVIAERTTGKRRPRPKPYLWIVCQFHPLHMVEMLAHIACMLGSEGEKSGKATKKV
jgi:hypothetical protein